MMELDTIVVGDCLDVMADMPDGYVDLVIVDPPYGIGYKSGRKLQPSGDPRQIDATFGVDEFDPSWLIELWRVCGENVALYLFTRWDVLHQWKKAAISAGFRVIQRIIWDKSHWGMGDLRYYGSQTEDILFCCKGIPILHWQKREGNIWRTVSKAYLPEGRFNHPTQKPEKLIERMIDHGSALDDLVFDPFIGSGTTAVAALKLGRRFYGCDINPDYVKLANERIEKARLEMAQLRMAV